MTSLIEFDEIGDGSRPPIVTRVSEVSAIKGELEDGTPVAGIIVSDVKKLLREAYMTGHSRRTNWEGYFDELNA